MRSNKNSIILLLLALLAGIIGAIGTNYFLFKSQNQNSAPIETAFERVMRTGTLRCGYWNWAPLTMPGENGQKITGIFYDFTEKLGTALSLKMVIIPLTYVRTQK